MNWWASNWWKSHWWTANWFAGPGTTSVVQSSGSIQRPKKKKKKEEPAIDWTGFIEQLDAEEELIIFRLPGDKNL